MEPASGTASEPEPPAPPTPSRRAAAFVNVAGMGANTLIVAVQAIVLVPLYLQAIGPRLYGAWLASGEMLNFLQLFDLGLTQVVTQRIGAAHARGDRDLVGVYFGSGLVALGAVATALALIALVVSYQVATWMSLTGAEARVLESCFRLGALATLLFVANFGVLALARGIQDAGLQNVGMVAGALAGFATSLALLLGGAGLWAAVAGMCVRTVVVLAFSIYYVQRELRHGRLARPRATRAALGELMHLTPATSLSGIGYLVVTHTDATIVGAMLGPERVPVLVLTRRAMDVGAALLHTFAYSSYAGFAHLIDSPQRTRAREVYGELSALWMAAAIAMAAGYVAVNRSLVSVWTSPEFFGGSLLTVLLALQAVAAGRAQLSYYLYRATGAIVPGSMLQFWESVARISLTIVLVRLLQLPGIAIAGIATAVVGATLASRRLERVLPAAASGRPAGSARPLVTELLLVAGAVLLGLNLYHPSWTFALTVGGLTSAVAFALLALVDPRLQRVVALGKGWLRLR